MKRHAFKMICNRCETLKYYKKRLKTFKEFREEFRFEKNERMIIVMNGKIEIMKGKILNKLLRRK